jgi:hypothetical protein
VIVLVLARLPQLVQPGAADHQGRVDLESIGAEFRVLEELFEAVHVALVAHIGQVGHEVRHDLEPRVLGEVKALGDCAHGVAAIGVTCHVLVHGLHSDLEARAAVAQHFTEMWLETVVGTRLNGESNALDVALLAVLDGLVHVVAAVARECVVQVAHKVVAIVRGE